MSLTLLLSLIAPPFVWAGKPFHKPTGSTDQTLSDMGRIARLVALARSQHPDAAAGQGFLARSRKFQPPADDDADGPAGGQAELSIAVDATGQHIVVGFNDTRGFNLDPISVSGFAYSDDGGLTFTDGGPLPATNNPAFSGTFAGAAYPGVFGDPDVKYVPGGNGLQFIYSSIMAKGTGPAPNFTGTIQTMCIHRSIDGGHTWQGPFEVTAATVGGALADKESIDVDPNTGRVLISWSSFGFGVDISTAYCDNIMSGNPPVWSGRSVLNGGAGSDQGSVPRFAGNGSPNVYVAWARSFDDIANNIGFARSTNHGATWLPAINLRSSDFFTIDYILGNDRAHQFPAMAVDNSSGPNQGYLYVVYADNNNHDGADIAFQRSTNAGASFSSAIYLNSRPGTDRAQWFPYVTVDRDSGRVSVIFYDQGIAPNGDLTELTWVYSDDGGVTWSKPSPLSARPFHAGYGNDTGQPNLGDYIGATARNGILYAAWAGNPPLVSFVDGQPDSRFSTPDFYVTPASNAAAALNLETLSFQESGGNGFIDPGDTVSLFLPLRNFVNNPVLSPVTYSSVTASLSSGTPGVLITTASGVYPDIAAGETETNTEPFVVKIQPGFVPGTQIELTLSATTDQGTVTLRFSQPTGTTESSYIFSENFDGIAVGTLPAGWTTTHVGGNNTVAWSTTNTVPGAPGDNALFHQEAEDGLNHDATRFERVATPDILIPSNSDFVTLDFDIWYDTEDNTYDQPGFGIYGFDGATLRIMDLTPGHFARANLAEAFAEEIFTGPIPHFPKHLPRSDDPNYFQDMSVWGGDSGGWQHVHMKLSGMAGTTIQLRWEYTQDFNGIATDVRPGHTYCGIAIDNVVLNNVTLVAPPAIQTQPANQISARGDAILFNVSALGTPPLIYQWTLNGIPILDATNSAYSINPAAVPKAGNYAVTISNAFGFAISSNAGLSVVDFAAGPLSGTLPLLVQFTNLSAGSLSNILWNFGDGNTTTESAPNHEYTNAGNYTVSLTGMGADGTATLTLNNYVIITNPPPPVIAGFNSDVTNGAAPLTVNFTNLSSGATSYLWGFGDGNSSSDPDPANTYTNAGNYTVTLTANGPGGSASLAITNFILVTNPPPPVIPGFISNTTNGVALLTVYFTNLSSGATSYLWDFGDGNSSSDPDPANTYTNAGNYTVTLTANGPGGSASLSITNLIVVTNPPPPVIPGFTSNTTNGVAFLTVYFTNLSSGATSYLWDFGDGNSSSDPDPANTYTNAGSYTVTLTANGPGGSASLAITNFIVVTNPPPPAHADFVANPTNGVSPLTVYFTNLSSSATGYLWDFGDGNSSADIDPVNTYTNPGSYTVALQAIAADGTNIFIQTNLIVVTSPPLPQLIVFPSMLDFGVAFTNTPAYGSLTISNSGDGTLHGSASLAPDAFVLLDQDSSTPVGTVSFTLPSQTFTNLLLRLVPPTAGTFSNAVVILSDGGSSTNAILGQGLPAPVLAQPYWDGSNLVFTFDTITGKTYYVEYKDLLLQPAWLPWQTIPGDGSPALINAPTATPATRFFRLRVQ